MTMIKNKNMITPNKQALADLMIEKFGDWVETISACNSGLYVHLSYENKYSHIYVIKNENDIERVYDEYSSIVVKAERHFQDTNILNAYLKNYSEDISVADMRKVVDFCNRQSIKLIYQYDFLGIMDNFRLTEKSIIGYDSNDNKVIFNNHSNKKYTFCKSALSVSKL